VRADLALPACLVDVRAKTDIYVGFLPSEALDRLLERRPIVLLTLAKRLISLLSPLGEPTPLDLLARAQYFS
jgi:lysophospholipid hydrolase